MESTVSAISKDKWLIRVERELDGASAAGEIVVLQHSQPKADDPPHLSLAGARAWLNLAKSRQVADDLDGSIAGARAGLEELGQHDYASSLNVIDDTSLHLELAEEMVEQGDLASAAGRLIRVLESRAQMYAELHADTIVE